MPSEPLKPFAPPNVLLSYFPSSIPQSLIIYGVVSLTLLFWTTYTLVAIYHWFKYSHASVIAIPAIVLHLGVSLLLISYILSGTFFL